MLRLGESIRARARGEEPPEDGYQGDYVGELADADPRRRRGRAPRSSARERRRAADRAHPQHAARPTACASTAGSPSARCTRATPSAVERALARLEEQGHLYRPDGALWLRTTAFGDDKDRVLERSTGEPTYFAADIAYHEDKLERGFDRLINVLGSDHHGYIARMKAAMAALGADPDRLEIPILQFVHIVEGGARASMSKRRGDFVTLDELIGEIGVDATRFFMLSRSHDSTIDLDLDLARRESAENPVYYVQYAHARIASVLRKAGDERVAAALAAAASRRDRAARVRARAGQAAAGLPRRGRGGGRAPRAAPDRRLRARARAGVHRLLPRLPRRRAPSRARLEDFRLRLSVASQRTIAAVARAARA